MKRGVFDLLRRGLDNTVANWQVSLIRLLEAFFFFAVAIGAVLVLFVPIIVPAGIHLADIDTPEEVTSAMEVLLNRWTILLWLLGGTLVLLLLFVVVHSFVEAGCTRVLVDGDRVAGPELNGPRTRYRAFSPERFLAGAKSGWWTVFWIYNIAWGVAGLIMLIPLLPTLAVVVAFHETEAVAVISGCIGLALSVMLMIVVAFVTGLWSNRALVAWGAHHTGASESLRIGWRALKSDVPRHLLAALAIIVVGMAGSMFFGSFSMFAGFGDTLGRGDVYWMVTLPLRLVGTLLNSAFSAVLGSWYLATYSALALDPK